MSDRNSQGQFVKGSTINLGRIQSPETRKKISLHNARYFLGKKLSRKRRQQLRRDHLGSRNPQFLPGMEKYRTHEWLSEQYITNQRSLSDIAKGIGVSLVTIVKWMTKVGIPRRICGSRFGPHNHSYGDGTQINSQGYRLVLARNHPRAMKNGYVREHILVAESLLKRFIKPTECVHHIDENKLNNDPSNLYLFATTREHNQYHMRKMKHSRYFIPITESNLSKDG